MSDWRPNQEPGFPPQQPAQPQPGAGYGHGGPSFTPGSQPKRPRGFRLGPMTLADVLDHTFRLFKANWKAFAVVTLIVGLPTILANALVTSLGWATGSLGGFALDEEDFATTDTSVAADLAVLAGAGVTIGVVALVGLIFQPLALAVISRMAAATYLGRTLAVGDATKGLLGSWLGLIAASLLQGLAVLAAFIVAALPFGLLAVALGIGIDPIAGVLVGVLAALCGFIGAIVIYVYLLLIVPAIAVEEIGPIKALGRSWNLVKSRFWPYFGTFIVVYIVATVVGGVVSTVFTIPSLIGSAIFIPLTIVSDALNTYFTSYIITPILALASLLIYFDARIRREGFDLQVEAARLPQADQMTPNDNA